LSRTFERSALSTQTPVKIDYSQFYRNLGDLVIEGACYGDPICETIYKRAWQKTTANMSENNVAGSFAGRAREPATDVDISEDSRGAILYHDNKQQSQI
jgi:hypothetical protein